MELIMKKQQQDQLKFFNFFTLCSVLSFNLCPKNYFDSITTRLVIHLAKMKYKKKSLIIFTIPL
ncbi:hypothetical protein BpHYR1_051644 [Brachionus plicatilis]|uniref:Uncharacterized protein n=1 Tax=Brachionus plicatilis TaxID=10195 RepID=A0A3M7S0Y3_BRAPC|nr:hypothetical protein BpHYR1_051644 [Brachionus plicatilis]